MSEIQKNLNNFGEFKSIYYLKGEDMFEGMKLKVVKNDNGVHWYKSEIEDKFTDKKSAEFTLNGKPMKTIYHLVVQHEKEIKDLSINNTNRKFLEKICMGKVSALLGKKLIVTILETNNRKWGKLVLSS